MAGDRFTCWMGEDEREALRVLAREHGCSENFIVRIALRALLFGKPVPGYLQHQADKADNRKVPA